VPSAELSSAQNVDEGKGDPLVYAWHDRLFAAWTERPVPVTVDELVRGYTAGTVGEITGYPDDLRALFPDEASFRNDLTRMWRLYNGLARAKRLQAPPVLSLKSRTFGFDLGSAQLPVFIVC
jgi:NAD+ synthase (glutamine-hydrolysing)